MKASLNLLEKFFSSCDQRNWGYSSSQISAAEEKLSISFPKILKQYYNRFGTCPYITQDGNNIPVPLALEDFFIPGSLYNAPYTPKELDFLVFSSISNVSAIDYGIRLSELSLEDPPIYLCDYGNSSWILENPSLLNFLVTAAFWQIAYESKLDYHIDIDPYNYNSQECPDLNYYLNHLGMNGYELENLCKTGYYRIFLKDDVILACETDEWVVPEEPSEDIVWLSIVSNNKEKIQAIQKIPNLPWTNNNL